MELAEPLRRVSCEAGARCLAANLSRWCSAAGSPGHARGAWDLLCEGNLAQVVAEFTDDETVVVANDAAATHSVSPPARHVVARVRDALKAHGLADLDERDD